MTVDPASTTSTGFYTPDSNSPTTPTPPTELLVPPSKILPNALRVGLRSLLLGYGIRSGLTLLLKLISVSRGKISLIEALKRSLTAEDSIRFSIFFGLFGFLWKGVNSLMIWGRGGKDDKVNGFVAGFVAGLSILAERKSRRIMIGQQMLVRALQGLKNHLKGRGIFHFTHGDSLIFALATAQVMYSYAMRPSAIPKSFYKFIQTTGPISEDVLSLTRQNAHSRTALHVTDVVNAVINQGGSDVAIEVAKNIEEFPAVIPCEIMHSARLNCDFQAWWVFKRVFGKIFPVYSSLNFVPLVLLRTKDLIKKPGTMIWKAVFNATRSAVFLSTYVSSYMTEPEALSRLLESLLGRVEYFVEDRGVYKKRVARLKAARAVKNVEGVKGEGEVAQVEGESGEEV
ncbi:hypothetical protein HDU76_008594 [Blyttiomyces sp. JEL0837]|nr:hypothetical protein HDU76_008594 [Blyttiomyces sp. JEL0837]